MKVVITADNMFIASRLKSDILSSIRGEKDGVMIDTWTFKKAAQNIDIIYHNPPQYINSPDKNVLFRVAASDNMVQFIVVWWKNNPKPSREMICLHVGRLTEMLLRYFPKNIKNFSVVEFND